MQEYFNSFVNFWLPIYEKQVFRAKIRKDKRELIVIKKNIMRNIHFTGVEKKYLIKRLNIEIIK